MCEWEGREREGICIVLHLECLTTCVYTCLRIATGNVHALQYPESLDLNDVHSLPVVNVGLSNVYFSLDLNDTLET